MSGLRSRPLLAILALFAMLIVGCEPTTDDVEVTGAVSWKGEPLEYGSIILFPADPHVAPVGGKVIDGQFTLRSKPGKMRVEIESVRDAGRRDPIDNSPLGEMFIPARYNKKSELTADVTRDGDNRFDFVLKE